MRVAVSLILGFMLLAGARGETGEIAVGPGAFKGATVQAEERAMHRVLEAYIRAIEVKDVDLFRSVKPNLSPEEERRARKAFDSVESQTIVMTILSVEVAGAHADVKVSRRDTINKGIVSSFPQTFVLEKVKDGWSIRDIGR